MSLNPSLYMGTNRVSQMVKECVETAGELGLDLIKTTPRHLDSLLGHKYHQVYTFHMDHHISNLSTLVFSIH
jgi:hypothetical protein